MNDVITDVIAAEGGTTQVVSLCLILQTLEQQIGSRRKTAVDSGISRGVIEAVLRGQTSSPTEETLEKLAATLARLDREGRPLTLGGKPFTADVATLKRLPVQQEQFEQPRSAALQAQASAALQIRAHRPVAVVAVGAVVINPDNPETGQEAALVACLEHKLQACLERVLQEFAAVDFSQSPECDPEKRECVIVSPAWRSSWGVDPGSGDEADEGDDDFAGPQVGDPKPMPSDSDKDYLSRLEAAFEINSALLLSTLVDAEISRLSLESLEDFGRHLARKLKAEPSLELTQRFTMQLISLSEEYRLPEDNGQRVTFLSLLAATLHDLAGNSFDGNVQALLEYLGV